MEAIALKVQAFSWSVRVGDVDLLLVLVSRSSKNSSSGSLFRVYVLVELFRALRSELVVKHIIVSPVDSFEGCYSRSIPFSLKKH